MDNYEQDQEHERNRTKAEVFLEIRNYILSFHNSANKQNRLFYRLSNMSNAGNNGKSTDDQMEQWRLELPAIYEVVSDQVKLLWEHMVSIIDDVHKNDPPGTILDLASGPGFPGLLLAKHFPMSKVTLSDYLPAMLDGQRKAVADLKLQDRVDVQQLDMTDLSSIPASSIDLVTCSLGLHLIPDGPVGALGEIARVLRPGGRLVASLWDDSSVMDNSLETMKDITGEAHILPFDPIAPAGGRIDPMCVAAGLTPGHHHNTVAPLTFNFGPIEDDFTFKVGMLMFLTKLVEIGKVEEAKESFIRIGRKNGLNDKGELLATQQYRIVSMTKK
jgi:ubiquinone/menaquinone biosynthesis C-methylase UbiE